MADIGAIESYPLNHQTEAESLASNLQADLKQSGSTVCDDCNDQSDDETSTTGGWIGTKGCQHQCVTKT